MKFSKRFKVSFIVLAVVLVSAGALFFVNNSRNVLADVPPDTGWNHVQNRVAGGFGHSLALYNGRVKTWGFNMFGQLGDGTNNNRANPQDITNFYDVVAVAVGSNHSLALKSDGTVWAWGINSRGQLGDGTKENRNTPVQTKNLTDIQAISAGYNFSIVLKKDGTLWAWGSNSFGELGNGTRTDSSLPLKVLVPYDERCTQISAGFNHVVSVCNGRVMSWGSNAYGQLGIGNLQSSVNIPTYVVFALNPLPSNTPIYSQYPTISPTAVPRSPIPSQYPSAIPSGPVSSHYPTPVPSSIVNPANITTIGTGGNHSFAVDYSFSTGNSNVWAWGKNESGQLGDGSTSNKFNPVRISALQNKSIQYIRGGMNFSVATGAFKVYSWGNNAYGQLGLGNKTSTLTPKQMTDNYNVAKIASGFSHTLIMLPNESVLGWGYNSAGQLGNSGNSQLLWPNKILDPIIVDKTIIKPLAAGQNHSLMIDPNRNVFAWGNNSNNKLCLADERPVLTAKKIITNHNIVDVSASNLNSQFVDDHGNVWGCGTYTGDGSTAYNPNLRLAHIDNVKMVSSGWSFTLALKRDGTVWGWGASNHNELGSVYVAPALEPIQIQGLSNIQSIAAGGSAGFALKNDGIVYSWGNGANLTIGNGTPQDSPPTKINNLSDITAISAGQTAVMALKKDGSVWMWGKNGVGQLGDNTTTDHPVPTQVPNLSNVKMVSFGSESAAALKNDNTLWTWGNNGSGQLGIGSNENKKIPTQVNTQYLNNIDFIIQGYFHALMKNTYGMYWAWGNNITGQLGNGNTTNQNLPQEMDYSYFM